MYSTMDENIDAPAVALFPPDFVTTCHSSQRPKNNWTSHK